MLVWARDWLQKKGVDSPRLDAELLLADALKCDRVRLYIDHDKPLSPDELARFKQLIQRRAQREPVAYILGVKEFYGRPFAVDKRAFIPRPETELLVQAALQALDERAGKASETSEKASETSPEKASETSKTPEISQALRVLDLCAGSGAIGVSIAAERENVTVDLVELSTDAVLVTRQNAERHGAGRAHVHQGDLFAPLTPGTRYDVITANPPYIPATDKPTLAPEIVQHEPALALFGGDDGLVTIRRLVAEVPRWLSPRGSFFMELDPSQDDAALHLAERAGLIEATVVKDLAGLSRVLCARSP
ncbi:MAG: peptide chain release factor N(5)-glutamine methyltransferase [Deltaproteobacteria bacterium]|nr:peptide chain release factor N(5)-glutamine methyltransferase [Deltaproteobacteria bacterium]